MKIIVSKCLLGEACRYDGKSCPDARVIAFCAQSGCTVIPVCPETEGGQMSTPRISAERVGKRVLRQDGVDVTDAYRAGAEQVLRLAKEEAIPLAVLKSRSPACGVGQIYDGTFSRTLKEGDGVLAELLKKNGIRVLSENDLASLCEESAQK